MADRSSALRSWLLQSLRAARRGVLQHLAGPDRDQWQALAAYRGLVHQAFATRPLAPEVCAVLWEHGAFHSSANRKAFFSPAQRELENSSHHYGHDVQIKRHAGLPLIGPPLPWLLEHGLKVSRTATFESPRPWTRGYLCMGPRRAAWLQERFNLPAHPIGPWIHYAQPVLAAEELARLREMLGPTLLVVLAHSWDQVKRHMDLPACVAAVAELASAGGYRSVIWLRHWQDPQRLPLPPQWIVACNGHRSNPWFLDAMLTLLSLSDAMATNAFGTHLGYGVSVGLRLHWLALDVDQNLCHLDTHKAEEEREEWQTRQRLSLALREALSAEPPGGEASPQAQQTLRRLLDPFWGFDYVHRPQDLAMLLRCPAAFGPAARHF
jgi:hypothetical protein